MFVIDKQPIIHFVFSVYVLQFLLIKIFFPCASKSFCWISEQHSAIMTDDVKRYFNSLMQKIVGLQSVLVTDRDGIPLIRVANEHAPELAMKPSFLSTFTMATDQSSKLGLGKNQTIICMYSNYQVVQMNKLPLIVTFIGSVNCNTGHILALESQIDNYLDDVKQAVIEA